MTKQQAPENNTELARLQQIQDLLFGDQVKANKESLQRLENQFNQHIEQLSQQLIALKEQSMEKVDRIELANLLDQVAQQLRQKPPQQ